MISQESLTLSTLPVGLKSRVDVRVASQERVFESSIGKLSFVVVVSVESCRLACLPCPPRSLSFVSWEDDQDLMQSLSTHRQPLVNGR